MEFPFCSKVVDKTNNWGLLALRFCGTACIAASPLVSPGPWRSLLNLLKSSRRCSLAAQLHTLISLKFSDAVLEMRRCRLET